MCLRSQTSHNGGWEYNPGPSTAKAQALSSAKRPLVFRLCLNFPALEIVLQISPAGPLFRMTLQLHRQTPGGE